MGIFVALLLLAAILVAIRVWPTDVEKWHQEVRADENRDLLGAAIRVIPGTLDIFENLDKIARSTPRTKKIAGDINESRITYVTRSKWIGFPDYTTVELQGQTIKMFARLRFGRSDLGVNRARLEGWIAQLKN